jgi:Ca2+/Na+ antiporter
MMPYHPRPWKLFIPLAALCVALYFLENGKGDELAWVLIGYSLIVAVVWFLFHMKCSEMWTAYYTDYKTEKTKTPQLIETVALPSQIPDLSEPTYQTVIEFPKFDNERQMANILVHMHKHFDDDFTEKFWLEKPRRFMGSPGEFRSILSKWMTGGVISRVDPKRSNSTYRVMDERKLELIARGVPLPPPPN